MTLGFFFHFFHSLGLTWRVSSESCIYFLLKTPIMGKVFYDFKPQLPNCKGSSYLVGFFVCVYRLDEITYVKCSAERLAGN